MVMRTTTAQVRQRIAEEHKRRGLQQDTEQWLRDSEVVEKQLPPPTRQQRRRLEQRGKKLHERKLRLLTRDDEFVRAAIGRKERLSGIMSADHATNVDELLWFLADELELLGVLEELAPPTTYVNENGKEVQRRSMYSPLTLNLLGLISRVLGLSSGPDIQAAVLTDPRWMELLGFNAQEVEEGATRRSESLRGQTREGQGGGFADAGDLGPARARIEGPRGALSSQTMAGHESAVEVEALVKAFNAFVRALAKKGYFAPELEASLDSTLEEVVPSFQGAGTTRRKQKVKSKRRRPRQVQVSIDGFKVWYVMDAETGLPIAMTLDTIETGETIPARQLMEQAEENLRGYAGIVGLAIDRGFLDGDFLWWLKKEKQIDWVCPAKENMHITSEARDRVAKAVEALRKQSETPLDTARRAAGRNLTHDGVRFFERKVGPGRDTLVVAQVDNLLCTDFYGSGGSASSRLHSKKFLPTPLYATVVLSWPDRSRPEQEVPFEDDQDGKGPLVLLSPIIETGLRRYDRYDDRSLIENRANRDAKQYFGLGNSLARNRRAMESATVMSTMALMLYRAFELHEEKSVEEFDQRCERLGVLRYRRQTALKNRGRIIVVVDDRYAFFTLTEFAQLAGFDVT